MKSCKFCLQNPCICHEGEEYNSLNPAFPCFINIFEVGQCNGGPEEGGWWYNAGNPLESIRVTNKRDYNKILAQKRKEYQLNDEGGYLYKDQYDHPEFDRDRNSPHSATGTGYEYMIRIQKHFAKPFPEERPHYE